jgi:hypothetical protein
MGHEHGLTIGWRLAEQAVRLESADYLYGFFDVGGASFCGGYGFGIEDWISVGERCLDPVNLNPCTFGVVLRSLWIREKSGSEVLLVKILGL